MNNYPYKWKYEDAERPSGCCYDCMADYDDFPDMIIKDEHWELINPTHHKETGILCPTCISNRLNHIGLWYKYYHNFMRQLLNEG